jgi:hypothetical protein
VPKRPRFSRWRRIPGLYRTGEEKVPDPNEEQHRISLYVPWRVVDLAEGQATRLGYPNVQDYCTVLVLKAVDAERVREQVADVEARRGPLVGLQEIADDPEYLAELSNSTGVVRTIDPQPWHPEDAPDPRALRFLEPDLAKPGAGMFVEHEPLAIEAEAREVYPPVAIPAAQSAISPSAQVVLRHAGQLGETDPSAFLPCLRRGLPVPPTEVAELAQALNQLEREYQGASVMDRRLTFALHRLAFESQILHTDAYPGAFDVWTIDMLRSVQEVVERILSGQDIRYYPDASTERPH